MANSNFRTLTLDKLDGVASTRNYIKNGSALQNVKGWATYADAAGTSPVDGTGGSPTVTWTRTTSSPLSLDASFLFTKDAASRQGQGASYDFTIDRADQAKVCRIDFDYEVASGTYADGDLTVWLYDITNAQLIQPSASSILNAIGPQKKQPLSFQTNSDSTSYRLIIHVASTSASAYTVKFDGVSVTRESTAGTNQIAARYSTAAGQSIANGGSAAIIDFGTKVFDSTGAVTTGASWKFTASVSGIYRISASIVFTSGGGWTNGEEAELSIFKNNVSNTFLYLYTASATHTSRVSLNGTATVSLNAGDYIDVRVYQGSGAALTLLNSAAYNYIDIERLDTAVAAQDAETRVVAAKYSLTSDETTAANADHIMTNFTTKVIDTHGAMSSSRFTAPIPGIYKVRCKALTTSVSWTTSDLPSMYLAKNGSTQVEFLWRFKVEAAFTERFFMSGETIVQLNAGEYVEINIRNAVSGTVPVIASGLSFFEVERISGPAQIAANEKVGCRYGGTTTGGLTSGSTVSIVMNTKVFDTHGMYNTSTGEITIPVSGTYRLSFKTHINSYASGSTSGGVQLSFQKNGAGEYLVWSSSAKTTSSVTHVDFTTGEMDFIAGDKIIPRFFHGMGGAGVTLLNNVEYTWVSCVRIG